MISRVSLALLLTLFTSSLHARQASDPATAAPAPEALEASALPPLISLEARMVTDVPNLSPRGLHHDLIVSVVRQTNSNGAVSLQTNSYWHLQPGANYLDETGILRKSNPRFTVRPGYAVAEEMQHKVWLAANLNTEGHVLVTLPDGTQVVSQVAGLRYFDPISGKSVVLSNVKDSKAYVINDQQVLYEDAFESISADVRYTIFQAGFEQDILLHENPPSPESYGLDPITTRLEVLTEFLNSPTLSLRTKSQRPAEGVRLPGQELSAFEQEDQEVTLGQLKIGLGRAFSSDTLPGTLIPVSKRWETHQSRRFLVEAVQLMDAQPMLLELPRKKSGASLNKTRSLQKRSPFLEANSKQYPNSRPHGRQLASAENPAIGVPQSSGWKGKTFILDYYSTIPNAVYTNFTFQGDQTYYIAGSITLAGTTTLEGGTVIKYAPFLNWTNDAIYLSVGGPVLCKTTLFHPATFTGRDDDRIGAQISSSTHVLIGAYGNCGLGFWDSAPAVDLHDLRFFNIGKGIVLENHTNNRLRNLQFICKGGGYQSSGIEIGGFAGTDSNPANSPWTNYVGNTLFSGLGLAFYGMANNGAPAAGHLYCEHITSDNNYYFAGTPEWTGFHTVWLRNSLMGPVGDPVHDITGPSNRESLANIFRKPGTAFPTAAEWASTFTTGLAGRFYLPPDSPYKNVDAAARDLDPQLLADMRNLTTDAPIAVTGAVPQGTVFQPFAFRDIGVPDLGYHYPAIDYTFTNNPFNPGTILFTNGVSVAWSGSGFASFSDGTTLNILGTPDHMSQIVNYRLVQEGVLGGEPPATGVFNFTNSGGYPPSLNLRFASVQSPAANPGAGIRQFFGARSYAQSLQSLNLRDSEFGSTEIWYYPPSPTLSLGVLFNNLFERTPVNLLKSPYYNGNSGVTFIVRNNLFYQSPLGMEYTSGSGYNPTWTLLDNVFDQRGITLAGNYISGINRHHNGFVGPATNSTSGSLTNVLLASFQYAAGPYGGWYHGSPEFKNRGSAVASDISMYHYTTVATQEKEANSGVDLGYHLVATAGQTTVPAFDFDSDTLPDYLEDTNGDGVAQTSESNWTLQDSDNDGVVNEVELAQGTNPFDAYDLVSKRLAYWKFNAGSLTNEDGCAPILNTAAIVDSFDGSAASFTSTGHSLIYPWTWTASGITRTNLNFQNGSLRFTYVPAWYTGNTNDQPGTWCRLLECGAWALSITPNGNSIVFQSDTADGAVRTNCIAALPKATLTPSGRIGWEITLNYTPVRSWISINGVLAGVSSLGVPTDIPPARKAAGWRVGSCALKSSYHAHGFLDELETFNAVVGMDPGKTVYDRFFQRAWDPRLRRSDVLSATDSDAGIRLNWVRGWEGDWLTNSALYSIQRKLAGTTAWSTIAPEVRSSTWQDTSVKAGEYYEYRIRRHPGLGETNMPAIAVAHRGAVVDSRGTAILLIDNTLSNLISADLLNLKQDLIADGWSVFATNVPRHVDISYPNPDGAVYIRDSIGINAANAASIKATIARIYAQNPQGTNVVYLIGHVSIPYSGFATNIDNHAERNGALPTDAWYGDMTGQWTDTKTVQAFNAINSNLANDGRWDQDTLPLEADGSPGRLEVAVGRVDFAGLAVAQDQDAKETIGQMEVRMLKRYLDKASRFRRGLIPYQQDLIAWIADEKFHDLIPTAQRLQTRLWNREIGDQYQFNEDLFRATSNHLWGIHGDYGAFNAFGNNQGIIRQHLAADVAKEPPGHLPRAMFQLHFGSLMNEWCRWDGDALRVALGVSNAVVSITWLNTWQGTFWKADRMHTGGHLGFALQDTFSANPDASCRSTALLGDPFLREFPLPQVGSLSAIKNGSNISLSWPASSMATAGYRIYRATSANPNVWEWKANVASNLAVWTDFAPSTGNYVYLIKALALSSNSSGTFTNMSVGTRSNIPVAIP